jgi:hypothetical protein
MSIEVGRKNNGASTGTSETSTAGFTACVRYGFPKDADRPRQQGTLTSIYAPVPEDATTVSPVYLVPTDRYEHQFDLEYPWAIEGKESCIAQEIQNECEQSQRVWYPVYVESDETVLLDEMARSLAEFVRDVLDMAPEACTFYYSGGRSIHVHVPRFIETKNDLKILKKRAEKWNEQADIAVDTGIYSRKRQFRLPGVEHEKRGLQKAPIEPEWNHAQIFRAATRDRPEAKPETYDGMLETVFGAGFITLLGRDAVEEDELILQLTRKKGELKVPVEEWPTYPEYNSEVWRWHAYNSKEFSPYANTATGDRSVCALEVVGTPYSHWKESRYTLVPARFYGAVGCDGKFTKESGKHAPLQLSGKDYEKYERRRLGPGDCLVIIGGRSRSSKLLRVSQEEADIVGELLTGDEEQPTRRRQSALDYLTEQGYDVGAAGYNGRQSNTSKNRSNQRERAADRDRIYPVRNPDSEASRLQQRAEQEPGAITEFTHQERFNLACRLLRLGSWDAVWEWFKQQFDDDFRPDVTYTHLTNIVNQYPDDYTHIEVPSSPVK